MKKNKIRKTAITGGHAVLAVIIIAIVFLVIFSYRIHDTFTDVINNSISRYVKFSAESLSASLESNARATDYMAGTILAGNSDENSILNGLDAIKQISEAYEVMYVTTDKKAIAHDGVKYDLSSVEYSYIFETTEKAFYYTPDDGFMNSEAFIVCCPIKNSNDKVIAYLIEFLPADIMVENLSSAISYSYSFYTILDRDNNVTAVVGRDVASEFLKGNLAENVDKSLDKGSPDWDVLSTSFISKGIQKTVHATMGTDARYIIYAPVEAADWTLMAFVRESYVEYEVDKYNDVVEALIAEFAWCLASIFIVFIVIMVFIFLQTRESHKELEGKAETDLLTGLCNKLTTEKKIAEYIKDNPESQGVFLLIDVDNFKKVNDTMGHAFGDEVLRTLGVKLKSLYRATDIIGRIGGDEFVVFLKDINDVEIIARESRKLENFFKDFIVGDYVKYTVTASLGAAIYSMDGVSFEELYKNADRALYDAKHKGKKQLAFFNAESKSFLNKDAQ